MLQIMSHLAQEEEFRAVLEAVGLDIIRYQFSNFNSFPHQNGDQAIVCTFPHNSLLHSAQKKKCGGNVTAYVFLTKKFKVFKLGEIISMQNFENVHKENV